MSCQCGEFRKTLHYVSPGHGGWGVIRIAALIPESYQLFVSPFACGRHGALGGAVNGIKDRISYVYIDESDIVSGNYENLIPDAVDELLEFLDHRPKVLLIFVSCLDDLLGTDHVDLNRRLSMNHPDIQFRSCHMNPISMDTKFPPGVTLQNNIYSLLRPGLKKAGAINLIGNHSPVGRECELFEMMKNRGYEVNHITDYETFEDFQTMASSCLNLVLSPVAGYACREMEKSLGIPFLDSYVTYELSEIKEFYRQLGERLQVDMDTSLYEARAEKAIRRARETIGDHPVSLDFQAVKKPFTLAKALLEYGFRVELVMADEVKVFEKASYRFIVDNHPEVEIVNALHHDMAKSVWKGRESLCIGFVSGYATGSGRVVNLMDDEYMFGFYGITKLMGMMEKAYLEASNLQVMIEEAGLVI
ncbi:nitrogenase component 1 [Lachnospiraceae bacterium 54-53]